MLVQGLWVFPCTLNIHFPTLACNQMSIHRIGDNVIAIVVDEGDATSVMIMIMEWSNKHPMHHILSPIIKVTILARSYSISSPAGSSNVVNNHSQRKKEAKKMELQEEDQY